MKIFKDWEGDKATSFVMFLAKETKRQKQRMRDINSRFTLDAEIDFAHLLHVQQGVAAQSDTLFSIAKEHFGFLDRKTVNKNNV